MTAYVNRIIAADVKLRPQRWTAIEGIKAAASVAVAHSIDFWRPYLEQRWLIADHWSAYHDMVATDEGWTISYDNGLWKVVTIDKIKFKDNDAAHNHVKLNEHDQLNRIYAQAIEAVVMGNFKGAREIPEYLQQP